MTNINKTELDKAVKASEKALKVLIDELKARIVELEKSNKGLVEKNEKLETELNKIKGRKESTLNVANWANVVSRNARKPEDQLVVVNAAINEQREREKRKKNVIVFGVAESSQEVSTAD